MEPKVKLVLAYKFQVASENMSFESNLNLEEIWLDDHFDQRPSGRADPALQAVQESFYLTQIPSDGFGYFSGVQHGLRLAVRRPGQ
jgi:hypothetical protein